MGKVLLNTVKLQEMARRVHVDYLFFIESYYNTINIIKTKIKNTAYLLTFSLQRTVIHLVYSTIETNKKHCL